MKRLIAVFIALSAGASLAQDLAQTIEVRVVNVDVVVRDRAGKPVAGLTKADFEIYENGESREITNLYEVRPAAAPPAKVAPAVEAAAPTAAPEPAAEIRPRNIIMFVDNYSLQPGRREKVLQSLLKFTDEQLRPQDKVMLVVCTQQTKVVTPFTSDRKAIRDGVESIRKIASGAHNRSSALDELKRRVNEYIDAGKEGKLSFNEYYRLSLSLVDSFVEEEIFSSKNTLAAVGQTAAALGGLEGKNVLVFAGAHLPQNPGAETYQWLYGAFLPYIPSLTLTSESISGKNGSLQHYSIEDAARQASANNVTLYMIDAADTRDSNSAENSVAADKMEQFATFTNTALAYQTLARISGGMALTNSDNFDAAFAALAADLNSYYALGFRPVPGASADARKIVVKMKNPAYRVRAREMYMPKATHADDALTTRVIANLYTTEPPTAWQVEVKPGIPEKVGDEYRVPFEVTFAPEITLLPKEGNLAGDFAVYVVAGNGGATSQVLRNVHSVKVPVDAEDDFREKRMTYKAVITMTPGDNTLSVAIVDQVSKKGGFGRATVRVP
jgi:VWFA-related protein